MQTLPRWSLPEYSKSRRNDHFYAFEADRAIHFLFLFSTKMHAQTQFFIIARISNTNAGPPRRLPISFPISKSQIIVSRGIAEMEDMKNMKYIILFTCAFWSEARHLTTFSCLLVCWLITILIVLLNDHTKIYLSTAISLRMWLWIKKFLRILRRVQSHICHLTQSTMNPRGIKGPSKCFFFIPSHNLKWNFFFHTLTSSLLQLIIAPREQRDRNSVYDFYFILRVQKLFFIVLRGRKINFWPQQRTEVLVA